MLKITIKIQENKGKENAKMTISYPNKEEYEKATKIEKMCVATIQTKLNETFNETNDKITNDYHPCNTMD